MAQETDSVTVSPVMQGMQVARDLIEEDLGYRMPLRRWRFFEDNWTSAASAQLYGFYGIDSCAGRVAPSEKRDHILFGWTYIFTETSGAEHQARVSFDLADSVICDEVQIPPQYAPPPVVEAAPAADEPAEAQEAAVVVGPANAGPAGFALGGHVAGLDGAAVNAMRSAGMTWVKKQVRHGQSDGGGIIAQAKAHGFKVLLGALGDKNQLASNFEGYVAEFAKYVAFLAQQGADAIEVWNEPNIEREWPRGQVNGASYTRLLQAAYQAIKAANPATIVISGAPAPTGFFGAAGCGELGCNDDTFMSQMAQAGAAQYMDCLGLHYNEGVLSPTQTGGDPRGYYPTYFFGSMLQRGAQYFPTSKVCWTELGYLSGEGMPSGIPGGFNWTPNDPVTVAEQAQWLADAARLSRNSGRVSLMIVWNVNFTAWGADPQYGYAIIRPGGGCPACNSLRAAMGG
ncbi:MAG: hypothetical protein OXG78_06775 [Chloroflexi bacterium]|nr:hypothetical protein [Chloroflexota bacterium]